MSSSTSLTEPTAPHPPANPLQPLASPPPPSTSPAPAPDRLTRGIVIALSLVAPNLRAFKPDALDDVLAHVQIHGPARQSIISELEWLRQQIAR